jgi:hypothetical protein
MMQMATIGIVLDEATADRRRSFGINVFELYIKEILAHAGIPYTIITKVSELKAAEVDIAIASVVPQDEETAELLWKYAEDGGSLVSYGNLRALAKKLGSGQLARLGAGYARLPEYGCQPIPVRYLSAEPWRAEAAGVGTLHTASPEAVECGTLLQQWEVGRGSIHRWAVDIPTTVVQLQQGTAPVLRDGIPAADGTAEIDEGILKADDGIELDWEWDRKRTVTGMPYFAYPYADYWREALISHLIQCALAKGLTLPFVDYWPAGVERVALISFDSDFNIDETAITTLDVLKEQKLPSTWCMIEPGYSPSVYERVRNEGHELALHYNALEKEGGVWSSEEFTRQRSWVQSSMGLEVVTSNKNHYTRYEGWGELFRWCEENDIEVDQTRGPTKRGNVGFLFGTCQPYFPIAWFDEGNRIYNVLEIGFLTQDLCHPSLSDTTVIEPFLEQVANVGGVAHFLFHQIHIHRLEQVRKSICEVSAKARSLGFVFWTSKQVNDWQRARRTIKLRGFDTKGQLLLDDGIMKDPIAVWIPIPAESVTESGDITYKYGTPCIKQVITTATREDVHQ